MIALVREADSSTIHSEGLGTRLVSRRVDTPLGSYSSARQRIEHYGHNGKMKTPKAYRICQPALAKPCHMRPPQLRHDFADEFEKVAWKSDFAVEHPPTVANPSLLLDGRK